jgi:hypothetical protein
MTARSAQHSLVLAHDGIIDPIAVEITARGTRTVALTPAERQLAAAPILARAARLPHLTGLHVKRNHRPHARDPMQGRDVMTQRVGAQHDTRGGAMRSATWRREGRHCAMAARQALNLCETELLMPPGGGAHIPQGSASVCRGQSRISVITTRAALRAAGAPSHIAAALRSRLRLITEPEAG